MNACFFAAVGVTIAIPRVEAEPANLDAKRCSYSPDCSGPDEISEGVFDGSLSR